MVRRLCYTYRRGALALLVSDIWALAEPQGVKQATVQGFTLFYVLFERKLTQITIICYISQRTLSYIVYEIAVCHNFNCLISSDMLQNHAKIVNLLQMYHMEYYPDFD